MQAKFLTSLALSLGLHLLCLTPLFLLGAPAPPPQAEIIDVSLVDKHPRKIEEIKPPQPTEITRDKKEKPPQQVTSTMPPNVQPQTQAPADAPEPEGVSLETEGKVNIGYMQRLKVKIFRAWQYPQASINAGHQGLVKIVFVLDEKGSLVGIELLTGSGHNELDQAVVQAVKDASPFGPFTSDVQEEKTLKVTGRFRYVID